MIERLVVEVVEMMTILSCFRHEEVVIDGTSAANDSSCAGNFCLARSIVRVLVPFSIF